jgi:hypothetical protein
MAAAGKWKRYDIFSKWIGDGTFDLDANTIKCALFQSTSDANTLTNVNSLLGDLTNEHANANGYTTGGVTVAATWVESAGVTTFDVADAVWTASGGSIVARFAVLYASGTLNGHLNPLIAVCLLDTAPADVIATTGNTLTIQINASGVFTLSAGQVD